MHVFARLLLALSLLATACTAASQAPNATVDGRVFLSTAITDGDDPHPLVDGTQVRIAFRDGQITLSAGCNTIGGAYAIADGRLLVSDLSTTEMGCDPDRQTQDEWLASFIGARPTLTLDGSDLTLQAADTVVTLLDREVAEPDRQLIGPIWTVVSVISGEAVSSVPDGVLATLRFTADGTVEVQTGCNRGGGPVSIEGDTLRFGDIGTTLIGCGGAQAQMEAAMLALLNADAIGFRIDASTLELLAGGTGFQLQGS